MVLDHRQGLVLRKKKYALYQAQNGRPAIFFWKNCDEY
jgi:hypothetical protein